MSVVSPSFWLDYLHGMMWLTDAQGVISNPSPGQIQGWIYFLGIYAVVTGLMVLLHQARGFLTLAPMLAFAGLITFLVWQLAQIGWWVDWQDYKINAALLSIIPSLLLGIVIIYAMDGTKAARAYCGVLLGGSLLGMGYAYFLDILADVTPMPSLFITPLWSQLALTIALAASAVVAVLASEWARRLHPVGAMVGGFIAGLGVFLPLWSYLTYGFSQGLINVAMEWPEYLLMGLPALPVLLVYNWLAIRNQQLMPTRPVAHFLSARAQTQSSPGLNDNQDAIIAAKQQISELRQLNQALSQAETLRHQQMQLSPLSMLELDRNLKLNRFNQAAEAMLAQMNDQPLMLGAALGQYWPDLAKKLTATDWSQQKLLKHQWSSPQGTILECTVLPMGDTAKPLGYSLLAEDVSAREQAAHRRLLSERIRGIHKTGQVIHHDFSNLMLAIQSHLQLLAQKISPQSAQDGELAQAIAAIQDASQRGRDLLAQLHSGQAFQKPELRPQCIGDLLTEAVRLITPQARSKQVAIILDPMPELWVEIDASQILRVVMNLLANALRAVAADGVVHIRALPDDHGVTVDIADNGCGMSGEQLAQAFDPGFTTKAQGQGGLGLAISYLITEAHGGKLSLNSAPQQGTIAKIWLPLWRGALPDIGFAAIGPMQGEKILVFAAPDVAAHLAAQCEALGAEVAELTSGEELAALLTEAPQHWTMLIRDKDMPLSPELWHQCRFLTDVVIDAKGKTPPRIRLGKDSRLSADNLRQTLAAA